MDSTAEQQLQRVIKRTKNKLFRHPHLSVAYRCILAYLYSIEDVSNFDEAYKYLEGTEPSLPDQQCFIPAERWLECEFIIRANLLKLRQKEALKNGGFIENVDEELNQLSVLWKKNSTKAAVFAIKGVTFSCFGPKRTKEAIDSYKIALDIASRDPEACTTWQKFDWLWECAANMSRVTRKIGFLASEATEEELETWEKVFEWKNSNNLEVTEALFYGNYAEALLNSTSHEKRCEEMIEKAVNMWKSCNNEAYKRSNSLVLLVAVKFCEKYPTSELQLKSTLFNDIDVLDYLGDENEIYRHIAMLMNYEDENQKAIDLLEKAVKKNGIDRNVQLETQLINRYSKFESYDEIQHRFDALFLKYNGWNSDIAFLYSSRSKWLFYHKICPDGKLQVSQDHDNRFLDMCMTYLSRSHIIEGYRKGTPVKVISSKIKLFMSHLQSHLRKTEHQRPEYFSWFKCNFWNPEMTNVDEIINCYNAVINDETCSQERRTFSKMNLALTHLQFGRYQQAFSEFRKLVPSEKDCIKFLVESVLQNPDRSLDDFRECLQLGNYDAMLSIIDTLDAKKKEVKDVKQWLLRENFSNSKNFLFFAKENYEICAMIQSMLECEHSVLVDHKTREELSQKQIAQKVEKFLEINVEKYPWRKTRLDMTKSFLDLQQNLDPQRSEQLQLLLMRKIFDTFHEASCALDSCISDYFKLKTKSWYPHACRALSKSKKKRLKKQNRLDTFSVSQRSIYCDKRMREQWLPSVHPSPCKQGVPYDVIELLLRGAFKEKGVNIPGEILKFLARREHHIITQEAAWLNVWIETQEAFRNDGYPMDLGDIERKLCEYRDITGMFENRGITAYEVAHKAAEFAEQTLAVFMV